MVASGLGQWKGQHVHVSSSRSSLITHQVSGSRKWPSTLWGWHSFLFSLTHWKRFPRYNSMYDPFTVTALTYLDKNELFSNVKLHFLSHYLNRYIYTVMVIYGNCNKTVFLLRLHIILNILNDLNMFANNQMIFCNNLILFTSLHVLF